MNNNEILKDAIWSLKRIVNALDGMMIPEFTHAIPRKEITGFWVICNAAADEWNVKSEAILDRDRWEPLSTARQVAMYLAHELTDFSSGQLAKYFKRHDSDVRYAIRSVQQRMETDEKFKRRVEAVRMALSKQNETA